MLLVIPNIELKDGVCSSFISGETGTEYIYADMHENPAKLCGLLRRENAKSVNITNLDSYDLNKSSNYEIIIKMSKSVDIPFSLIADFNSVDEIQDYLNNGIYRVVLNKKILSHSDEIRKLVKEYSKSRVSYIHKVKEKDDLASNSVLSEIKNLGIDRVVFYSDEWISNDMMYDEKTLIEFAENSGFRVTLYECVNNSNQLLSLQKLMKYGIDSLILGKPIYENKFPCQKIWRLIEADVESNPD